MTKLDKLNELLASETSIPQHRRIITPSFANHKWLSEPKISKQLKPETQELLKLTQKELLQAAS